MKAAYYNEIDPHVVGRLLNRSADVLSPAEWLCAGNSPYMTLASFYSGQRTRQFDKEIVVRGAVHGGVITYSRVNQLAEIIQFKTELNHLLCQRGASSFVNWDAGEQVLYRTQRTEREVRVSGGNIMNRLSAIELSAAQRRNCCRSARELAHDASHFCSCGHSFSTWDPDRNPCGSQNCQNRSDGLHPSRQAVIFVDPGQERIQIKASTLGLKRQSYSEIGQA